MVSSSFNAIFGLVILAESVASIAIPSPFPYGIPSAQCFPHPASPSDQHLVDGDVWLGGTTCVGPCTLTYTASHSYGYTWTEGADLGYDISEVLSFGLSFSVSETVTTTTAEGASKDCPDGAWTCSLMITPTMASITGGNDCYNNQAVECAASDCSQYTQQWTVLVPETDDAGVGAATVDLCACPNALSWADPGAPMTCPFDCEIG